VDRDQEQAVTARTSRAELNLANLAFLSILGGFVVQRYFPKFLLPVGAAVVGAWSNNYSWVSLRGTPTKPIVIGALMSGFFSMLPFLRLPAISGCLAGSTMYSMYYYSKHRNQLLDQDEFNKIL